MLDLKYTFDNGISLSSLTGYQDIESMNNLDLNATISPPASNIYIFNSHIDAEFYSQEFNLLSADDQPFRWTLGLFWQKQDSELPPWQEGGFNFIGNRLSDLDFPWFTSPWVNEEEDRAVFAHGRYRINEQLELEAGVRYGEYERDQFTNYNLFGFGDSPPFDSLCHARRRPAKHLEEDDVDWQVAVNWDASAMHYLYGLVSSGHVSGGINIFPPFPEALIPFRRIRPDGGHQLRGRMEGAPGRRPIPHATQRLLRDLRRLPGELFRVQSSLPGLNNPTLRNAETESTVWGIEFSGQARFGDFALDFGLAYMDSELGTFSDVRDPFRFRRQHWRRSGLRR